MRSVLHKTLMALLPPLPAKFKGRFAVCVVGLLLFMVAAVYGDHGLIHLLHMQSEQRNLQQMAFELAQQNEELRQRIRRLQSDDRYIEKVARERLGLAKPGEIIYRVVAPPPALHHGQ
jgi:cell division protein FtsB